jgi:hypothetical protein
MGAPFRDRLLAILSDEQKAELPGGVKVESAENRKQDAGATPPQPKGRRASKVEAGKDDLIPNENMKTRDQRALGDTKSQGDKGQAEPQSTKPE